MPRNFAEAEEQLTTARNQFNAIHTQINNAVKQFNDAVSAIDVLQNNNSQLLADIDALALAGSVDPEIAAALAALHGRKKVLVANFVAVRAKANAYKTAVDAVVV